MKNNTEKNKIIKEVQSLLKIKLLCFRSFYEISTMQKKVVEKEDNNPSKKKSLRSFNYSELEVLFLKKDNLIGEIKEIEKRIGLLKKRYPALEPFMEDNSAIKSFNLKISKIIDKIVLIEKEVTTILEKHKELTKGHAGTLRKGRVLISGYGGKKNIGPRFVDYKLE